MNIEGGNRVSRIDFSYAANCYLDAGFTEEKGKKGTHEVFRCHPSYHSFPYKRRSWHDWAMIDWEDHPDDVPGRILLWATLRTENDEPDLTVAAVRSLLDSSDLKQAEKTMAQQFTFGTYSRIESTVRVIDASSIRSVAMVLPCADENGRFPESVDDATHFVSIPSRHEWTEIGWDHDIIIKKYDF